MSNAVLFEETDGKAVVRFNRPDIRSPLSVEVLERLSGITADIEENGNVNAVIFTGTGNVFASGADLREIAGLDAGRAAEFAMRGQQLMNRIARLTQPTMAVVNGVCFGGALDLALACRFRIASPEAFFSHPGANLGIMTGWGGTQRLPRLIGRARALEMFFTASRVCAAEALDMGLIDAVVDMPLERALAS